MKTFLPHFEAQLGQMVWRLSSLVESETPTDSKPEVDRVIDGLAEWAVGQHATITLHPHSVVGDMLECRWNADAPGKPILLLCHVDTVHPLGSVEKYPTRIEEDMLYGMGAYDMKASIVILQTVIEQLHALGQFPERPIIAFFNTDEEIGSPYSRPIIEQLALESGLVLVLEFANYEEQIVTARKGVGIFQITCLGREAHSGSNPHEGINALVEAAHLIDQVLAISDEARGTLVTPTVIRGGTRHNVIPGECDLVINVRVQYRSEAERVEAALNALADSPPYLPGAERILTGEFMRPPMERDALMERTFEQMIQVAGLPFGETSRGGGSDASFCAALGIPTLDGFGASGEGAHSNREQVHLPSMPRRAALLAALLTRWEPMPQVETPLVSLRRTR